MRKFLSGILSLLLLMGLLPAAYAEEPALGVTYEIFVASFQDSDGDGIGDLQGIIDRLDYLQSLGVRQIWLMPIHPSPSYHKYDVLDYYAVDPSYGTLDDFDRLTAACKERGIRVILDLVLNHSSSSHPWFLAACDDKFFSRTGETTDWYVFYPEEGTRGTKSAAVRGGMKGSSAATCRISTLTANRCGRSSPKSSRSGSRMAWAASAWMP